MVPQDATMELSTQVEVIASADVATTAFLWAADGDRMMLTVVCKVVYGLRPSARAEPLFDQEAARVTLSDELLPTRSETRILVEDPSADAVAPGPQPPVPPMSDDVLDAAATGRRPEPVGPETTITYEAGGGRKVQSRLPGLTPHVLIPFPRAGRSERVDLVGDSVRLVAKRDRVTVAYRGSIALTDEVPTRVFLVLSDEEPGRGRITRTLVGSSKAAMHMPFRASSGAEPTPAGPASTPAVSGPPSVPSHPARPPRSSDSPPPRGHGIQDEPSHVLPGPIRPPSVPPAAAGRIPSPVPSPPPSQMPGWATLPSAGQPSAGQSRAGQPNVGQPNVGQQPTSAAPSSGEGSGFAEPYRAVQSSQHHAGPGHAGPGYAVQAQPTQGQAAQAQPTQGQAAQGQPTQGQAAQGQAVPLVRPSYLMGSPTANEARARVPPGEFAAGALGAGAVDASNWAAEHGQAPAKGRRAASAASSAEPGVTGPRVEILWVRDDDVDVGRTKRWAQADAGENLARLPREHTGAAELPRDDAFRWLARGRVLAADRIEAACPLAVEGQSALVRPAIVAQGRLVPRLSLRAELECAHAMSQHLAEAHPPFQEIVDRADRALANRFAPATQLQKALSALYREVAELDAKGEPLERVVRRELGRHRAYEEVEVLGEMHVVADLVAAGSDRSVPTYIVVSAAKRFPLEEGFLARIAATVHPRQDPRETAEIALSVLAVCRVLPDAASRSTGTDESSV